MEKYRSAEKDIIEIGKELNVAFILEGSLRKAGDDLRITVQLIDAHTGNHVWADTYTGRFSEEIFVFQSNIAKKVASSLLAVITPQEEKRIDRALTANMTAYDLNLRGHEIIRKWRYTNDTSTLKLALNLFNQSLQIDPYYIMPLIGKNMVFEGEGNYDSALFYCDKIIKLYPESYVGYSGKGLIYQMNLSNQDSAFKYLSKAVALEPSEPWAYLAMGQYFSGRNEIIAALPYYQKAYESGGESWAEVISNISDVFRRIGYYSKAEKYYKEALLLRQECPLLESLLTTFMVQGKNDEALHFLDSICSITACNQKCALDRFYIHTSRKEFDQAEQYYNQFLDLGGRRAEVDLVWLAYVYKQQQKVQEAYAMLNGARITFEKQLLNNRTWYSLMVLSCIHAILDEKDQSLKYLKESADLGLKMGMQDFLPNTPLLENLQDDPQFKAIIKKAQDEFADIRALVREMEELGQIDL